MKISKYQMLHDRGVRLSDYWIDEIVRIMDSGVQATARHYETTFTLNYMSSDNLDQVGYSSDHQSINLPIAWLKNVADAILSGHTLDTIMFVYPSGTFDNKRFINLREFLWYAGAEEAVHYLQHVTDREAFKAGNAGYMYMTPEEQFNHPIERFARAAVDLIAVENGKAPIWGTRDSVIKEYVCMNEIEQMIVVATQEALLSSSGLELVDALRDDIARIMGDAFAQACIYRSDGNKAWAKFSVWEHRFQIAYQKEQSPEVKLSLEFRYGPKLMYINEPMEGFANEQIEEIRCNVLQTIAEWIDQTEKAWLAYE